MKQKRLEIYYAGNRKSKSYMQERNPQLNIIVLEDNTSTAPWPHRHWERK